MGVDLRDMEACLFRMKKHILTAETETKQNKGDTSTAGSVGQGRDKTKGKGKGKTTAASKLSALAGDNQL